MPLFFRSAPLTFKGVPVIIRVRFLCAIYIFVRHIRQEQTKVSTCSNGVKSEFVGDYTIR